MEEAYLFGISHLVLIHFTFTLLIFHLPVLKHQAEFGVLCEFFIALVFLAYLIVLLKVKAYGLSENGVSQGLQNLSQEPRFEFPIGQLSGLLKHLIRQLLVNVPNVGCGQTDEVCLQGDPSLGWWRQRDPTQLGGLLLLGRGRGLGKQAIGTYRRG